MAHDNPHDANGAGYEVEDASIKEIVFTGIGLAVGTIIVCFAVAGLFKVLTATVGKGIQSTTEIPTLQSYPPGPRLQEKPWLELQAVRQHEDQILDNYGWVDKKAGTVRIPIERAMDLVVQHGLPVSTERATGATSNARK
jgi:hypothetical protein